MKKALSMVLVVAMLVSGCGETEPVAEKLEKTVVTEIAEKNTEETTEKAEKETTEKEEVKKLE